MSPMTERNWDDEQQNITSKKTIKTSRQARKYLEYELNSSKSKITRVIAGE